MFKKKGKFGPYHRYSYFYTTKICFIFTIDKIYLCSVDYNIIDLCALGISVNSVNSVFARSCQISNTCLRNFVKIPKFASYSSHIWSYNLYQSIYISILFGWMLYWVTGWKLAGVLQYLSTSCSLNLTGKLAGIKFRGRMNYTPARQFYGGSTMLYIWVLISWVQLCWIFLF